jgi:hypothetical protein
MGCLLLVLRRVDWPGGRSAAGVGLSVAPALFLCFVFLNGAATYPRKTALQGGAEQAPPLSLSLAHWPAPNAVIVDICSA